MRPSLGLELEEGGAIRREAQGEKRGFFSAQAEKRDLREKKSSKEEATETLEGTCHQAYVPISSQASSPQPDSFLLWEAFLFKVAVVLGLWLLQWLSSKESPCSAGGPGLIPGSGRSPGGGYGSPLQYSCQGNPRDTGAWQAMVHGVAKSQTQLNTQNFIYRGNTTLPSTTFCRLYSHLASF